MNSKDIIINTIWYTSVAIYFIDVFYLNTKRQKKYLEQIELAKDKALIKLKEELINEFANRGIRLNIKEAETKV